ncbi:hypothetical protein SAMN05421736_11818 [Evansella caseinilytica]|uniref:DUF2089 domain-containing protein n=1 Tax=Evansella caseinilytica TaxID=1503961 RepID=A0A1H3U3H1_9BACI|nr:DUF2089 domain-containing protein [Evansella caseinilytica]SDZ56888.1 hypothetical protein SAMN05421736_11818 [Evansella caseinilytica]
MVRTVITTCPICEEGLKVTKLTCGHCHTTIENTFEFPALLSLKKEQLQFIETFILCRGSIKEVEKVLNISYPTVRNKLEEIIAELGNPYQVKQAKEDEKKDIIDRLSSGELSAEDAIKLLKKK